MLPKTVVVSLAVSLAVSLTGCDPTPHVRITLELQEGAERPAAYKLLIRGDTADAPTTYGPYLADEASAQSDSAFVPAGEPFAIDAWGCTAGLDCADETTLAARGCEAVPALAAGETRDVVIVLDTPAVIGDGCPPDLL